LVFKMRFHTLATYILRFSEFQKWLNLLLNFFSILQLFWNKISGFLHYIWSFLKIGALYRCIPWLHNLWLVIALSIGLNRNIEELILSIVLLIPCNIIWRMKLHIFLLNMLILCFQICFKRWLFINYFNEKSMKYQLF
jgi:hypothetical protein